MDEGEGFRHTRLLRPLIIFEFGLWQDIANSASYATRKSCWICASLRFVLGLVLAPLAVGESDSDIDSRTSTSTLNIRCFARLTNEFVA